MKHSLLRALLGAIAAAPILIACSTPKQTPPPVTGTDFCAELGNHCVVVTVVDADTTIDVDNEYLRKHGNGKIRWRLENDPNTGQHFKFPDAGIAFKSSDYGTEVFTNCNVLGSAAILFVCDSGDRVGEYKYTITVTGGSTNPPPLDPHVVNN
jgi:hypothetical protein